MKQNRQLESGLLLAIEFPQKDMRADDPHTAKLTQGLEFSITSHEVLDTSAHRRIEHMIIVRIRHSTLNPGRQCYDRTPPSQRGQYVLLGRCRYALLEVVAGEGMIFQLDQNLVRNDGLKLTTGPAPHDFARCTRLEREASEA